MKESFWHERWAKNEIAFHEKNANHLMSAHFDKFNLPAGSRIFVPLCGKTRDIAWLLARGYAVVGAELSEVAIKALFTELGVEAHVSRINDFLHYHNEKIDIYVGNIFNLTESVLGTVNGIYDRAALVALPADLRRQYAAHLIDITDAAPQFLITFEYDQQLIDGPPFSVSSEALAQYYKSTYALTPIENLEVKGGLKGKVPATETLWLLNNILMNWRQKL
jgi:thiopurine S-methyltransferase